MEFKHPVTYVTVGVGFFKTHNQENDGLVVGIFFLLYLEAEIAMRWANFTPVKCNVWEEG